MVEEFLCILDIMINSIAEIGQWLHGPEYVNDYLKHVNILLE